MEIKIIWIISHKMIEYGENQNITCITFKQDLKVKEKGNCVDSVEAFKT